MDRWVGKVAVVTGASSGIGLATTRALFQEGMIVVGLARRKAKMAEGMKDAKGKGKFYAYECDVSKEQNVAQAFCWIKQNVGVVQVLVNNAAAISGALLLDTPKDEWQNIFDVNVIGLLSCTKHAVDMMKKMNVEGHIINMSSIMGHRAHTIAGTRLSAYTPSKFAVTGISEVLRKDLHGSKIRITNLSPGLVKTDLIEFKDDQGNPTDFAKMVASNAVPMLESVDIAEAILYILKTPPRVEITELTIRPTTDSVRD